MSRLTRKHESGEFYIPRRYEDENGNNVVLSNQDCIDKLAHYEDLEEQGRLMQTKLYIGQLVYSTELGIDEYKILDKSIDVNGITYTGRSKGGFFRFFREDEIGETVFLTKEETELKLAELKGTEE